MQFIDQVRITVRAGKGGDGIVAFRREKYVPAGGPSGGDGGNGGNIIFQVDSNLQTLLDFKFRQIFLAQDGTRGGPNRRAGAAGKDTILKVPPGTEVKHLSTGIIFGDLTKEGQTLLVAFGGRGGAGNARYLSNRNRAPEKYKEGEVGEEWSFQLELKLLAEVGIIGLPNAGKSTLISAISSARPKVADYPFTTLIPNLAVVRRPTGDGTLFADIPGLIAGAARGAGLGYEFLRHIQRTRLLIHLLDCSSLDPIKDLNIIEKELMDYGHGLSNRKRILVINKKELLDESSLNELTTKIEKSFDHTPILISAAMKDGLDGLLNEVWKKLEN